MIILNKYKSPTEKGIYIGRGSPLGNPYPITDLEPRDLVIDKYEIYLREKVANKDPTILNALNQLTEDSKLICFCAPKRCHGEVIEKIWKQINNPDQKNLLTDQKESIFEKNKIKNFIASSKLEGINFPFKVIIAGSRDVTDLDIVRKAYNDSGFKATHIVSGKARGVDILGEKLANELKIPVEEYLADWDKYGKSAGMIRNKLMASKADALIAIHHNNSSGTANMIKLMKDLNKQVYVVTINGNEIDKVEKLCQNQKERSLQNLETYIINQDPEKLITNTLDETEKPNSFNYNTEEREMAENTTVEKTKEFKHFDMFAKGLDGVERRPRLTFAVWTGNPRVTVFTNVPSDSKVNYGIIPWNSDGKTFLIFLDKLEQIAKGPVNVKDTISYKTNIKGEDTTAKDKIVVSELKFGKDEEGIVWIAVVAEGRPKIKFEFKTSDYHSFVRVDDGKELSVQELSVLDAIATVNGLRASLGPYIGMMKPPYTPSNTYKPNAKQTNSENARLPNDFSEDVLF